MLETLQEITSSPIANRFTDITAMYGIYGTYVDWQPGGLNNGGVYFVCGLDPAKMQASNLDMHQIIENNRKSYGNIRTDVRAFKVSGEQPLMTHRHIVNYCQQLDTLKKIYGYLNKPIPIRISSETISLLRMNWKNLTDVTKPIAVRQNYENILRSSVEIVNSKFNPQDPQYKDKQYTIKGYYDTGKGKFYNWWKKHFFKYKNEVSLTHLMDHSGRISSAVITHSSYEAVKKALNKRPDILYHFSEIKGGVLPVEHGEGYGSPEANDRRFFTLHYPAVCSKDIERILLEINHPTEFHRNLDEIDVSGYGTDHVVVPCDYINTFLNSCRNHGINICIDHSALNTISGGVPLAFSAFDAPKTYALLRSVMKVYENNRVLKPEEAGLMQPLNYQLRILDDFQS